jgi:cytochrome P450
MDEPVTTDGVPRLDLSDPGTVLDPESAFGQARERCPVARLAGPGLGPWWVATRHEAARQLLTDPRFEIRHQSFQLQDVPEDVRPYLRTMSELDGPEHSRLRRLVSPAFTVRRVAGLRPAIERIVDALLDDVEAHARTGDGRVDLLPTFARPLPMDVICELVGIPTGDRADWRTWGAAVAAGHGRAFTDAVPAIIAGARAAVARRRAEPRDDLLSVLIAVQDEDGDRLDDTELATLVWQLVLAGQTPTNLIANALAALFAHPDQLDVLRTEPSLLPGAVEELVRFCGPNLLAVPRFAREDADIAGVAVRRGDVATVSIVAANRDPRVFAQPDRLDVRRPSTTATNLGFGHGPHYCLGAPLARAETEVALAGLLHRFPDLTLAVPLDEVRRLPDPGTWRLAALPVRL